MIKLKECPFCGFEPDIKDPDCLYPGTLPFGENENGELQYEWWNINCYESGGGCSAHILGETAEECINKWNSRK